MARLRQNQFKSPPQRPLSRALFLIALLAIGLLIIHHRVRELGLFPESWNLGLREPLDLFKVWVIVNRKTHPVFLYFFEPLSRTIDFILRQVEHALLWLPWPVLTTAVFLAAQRIANLRMALLTSCCLFFMGLVGLWSESMATLALMLVSVGVSLVLGIPLGILAARSERLDKALRPLLDAMQTMPAFVYLIPVLLFFGVARVPSVVATVIYALPPAIRLTSLGIRQVSAEVLEAAQSFGATPRQILYKVQIPLAMPTIMAGVNQTIMMALGIVVIAALIGGGGLGDIVLKSLRTLKVGRALEAGLAIVFMAILLDRLSVALTQIERISDSKKFRFHLLPENWGRFHWAQSVEYGLDAVYRTLDDFNGWLASPLAWLIVQQPSTINPAARRRAMQQRGYWLTSVLLLLVLLWFSLQMGWNKFPQTWHFSIQEPVDQAVLWAQTHLYRIGNTDFGTGSISDFMALRILNPLRGFLTEWLSWPVVILLVAGMALAVSGWQLALAAAAGLLLMGMMGMWEYSMDTLSQVIIAASISMIIGIPLGILSARSTLIESLLRPVLDFLQTIPPFVYLVPVIMLFNLGRVPGIIASVLYALPPVIRLTNLGIRQVDTAAIEAAHSFGSTNPQILRKVQLPLALSSIMAGINQTIMMVLAMVIIAGLVGSTGLGFEVVTGLAQNQLGRGVEAGLAIVILAIILDRITQAWVQRRQQTTHAS